MTSCQSSETSDVVDIDATTSSGSTGDSCSMEEHKTGNGETTILCELVGARNLTIHDAREAGDIGVDSLRPYCVVNFGDKTIHETKPSVDLGCNPIWTMSTKSLFLLKTTPRRLVHHSLSITIMSKREMTLPVGLLGQDDLFLGRVNLNSSKLLSHCDSERFELKVKDEFGEGAGQFGTLALRFRLATQSDEEIVRLFQADLSSETQQTFKNLVLESHLATVSGQSQARPCASLVTDTAVTEVAQTTIVNALKSVFTTSKVRDKKTGTQKVRVKPYPDPDRPTVTEFMASQEIRIETKRPSHNWVEAGSGTLGKLYCEVLACHDLPNVDIGEAVGNVTDPFVCLVYEDTCAMTEVIDDELSPHWLPWTQRAFAFGMMHPASILYLGVFDYDFGMTHEPIGRVAINVSNLQRNTIHTLRYNLYPSSNVTDRTAIGAITVRLRIECHDEKAALLAALKPRPKIFVNVEREKSFKVVRYTCFGEYDGEEKFDLTVTRSYINEIFEYKAALGYAIGDTIESLIFWRGQVKIFNVMVPLHSYLFFCMAIDFVERPHMFVPYTFLCIAWMMLANLTMRRQHPSPWNTCPSFWHYLHILWTGKAPTPVVAIKEFQGAKQAQAYENAWASRIQQDQAIAEHRWKLQQELTEIGDDNISTKTAVSAIPLDMLVRLARWQGIVGRYCGYFRFIKVIVTWEESVVSFWITAGFLAGGIVTMLLPWKFILTWTGRIVVWGFLGPHMKLVDWYLRAFSKKDGKFKQLMQNFDVQSNIARLRREEAVKAKDIKELVFGKYSVPVPSFNLARHFDRPLPESSARLCGSSSPKGNMTARRVSMVDLSKTPWIPGQQLFGVMIPRPEHEALLYDEEQRRQESKLVHFKAAVEQFTQEDENLKDSCLQLDPPESDTPTSISLGYEVIPETPTENSHSRRNDIAARDKKTFSIVMSTDEGDDDDGSVSVVIEVDGSSVQEIKAKMPTVNETEEEEEEEGLEVVGLGRYSTLSEGVSELEQEILSSPSSDSVIEDRDSALSTAYKSSNKVDVAFYRPNKSPTNKKGRGATETNCAERVELEHLEVLAEDEPALPVDVTPALPVEDEPTLLVEVEPTLPVEVEPKLLTEGEPAIIVE